MMIVVWIASILATVYIADRKKRSLGGCFFLAIFTGPLAVAIVLLLSEKTVRREDDFSRPGTLDDAKLQLRDIQYSLHALGEKTKNLEALIRKLSKADEIESARNEPMMVSETVGVEPMQSMAPMKIEAVLPELKIETRSDLELDFGRNWLNKIGVVILGLGVAFLISYSFQSFGPLLRIVFGYGVAGLLFWIGLTLEAKEKFMKFGRVLLGGSWAIIYFTTYAMHHFEASRIITSPAWDLALLFVVLLGMIIHVLKYKSEAMMAVVLLVAYLTSTIGPITGFTFVSSLLLSGLVLFFVYRFQWVKTLFLGVILTYAIHYFWVVPNLLASAPVDLSVGLAGRNHYDFLNFVFLTGYWGVFLAGVHSARKIKDETLAGVLAAANFGNIALYSVLSYPLILRLFPVRKFEMVLMAGVIYLALGFFMKKSAQHKMFISDMVTAVFAITFSISLKFLPTLTLLLWLLEIPFLLFIGMNFKERIFKFFGYALTVLVATRLLFLGVYQNMPNISFLGFDWTWYGLMCFWASLSMAACFYLIRRMKRYSSDDSVDWLLDHVYSLGACWYFGLWVWSFIHQPWIAFALSLQGFLFLTLSLMIRLKRFRAYAYLAFGMGGIVFLWEPIYASIPVVKWALVGWNVLALFGVYCARKLLKPQSSRDLFFEYETEAVFMSAILVLVAAVYQYVALPWISLILGLASVAIIMTGFFDGNKTERLGGMALLALTLGRVVLVDLAGLEIIFKIVTLIILGVLFLGVSYIYNRFSIKSDSSDRDGNGNGGIDVVESDGGMIIDESISGDKE